MAIAPVAFEFEGAGVHLAGDRWTAPNALGVVVLLHGGGQTRHSWARTGERLAAAGWTAIAYDARGHGESEWHPDQDYSIDGFVADLLALLATLDEAPVLVGASLGGMTALVAAGEHPGLARAVVLVDIVVEVEPAGSARIRDFLNAHHDGFASLDDVADAIVAYNPVRRRPRNLDGLRKNVRQRADSRWYWHWDPALMDNDDEPQRGTGRARRRAAALQLSVPTLLVRGAESDVVSDAGMADMRTLVPQAEAVEIPGAAHMVAGDDNDVFATSLASFLARL
jgi:pimeloyl-ACP methyl ester carboxylesterase